MLFCGLYKTTINKKGEFSIPENLKWCVEIGAKYDIFYYPCEWEKGAQYISFVFENSNRYYDATFISSGFVTEDKKIKVPDEYIPIMQGDCELICNIYALELSKVPIDMLLGDLPDIKELNISLE